jgi:glucose/arabinose dehydrogenase
VVNERDGLGDETPPDYLTSVQEGGFYGWPYCYWDRIVDDRVPQDPALVARAITPDYALGGHTASLGLCWMPQGTLPGFPDGMVIGQHGSWNRSTLSGYKLIFVPFENGRPAGRRGTSCGASCRMTRRPASGARSASRSGRTSGRC